MKMKETFSVRGMNAGFVLSLSTLLFMSILIYYSFYYVSSIQQNQGNILNAGKISKIAFIQDDVLSDINRVLGKTVNADRNSSYTTLSVWDKFPLDYNQNQLLGLKNFVEGNYASKQNASLTLDISRLTDGRQEIIFGDEMQYTYSGDTADNNNIINLFVPGKDTNIIHIDINLNVKSRYYDYNAWDYNSSGGIAFTLNYQDYNASHTFTSSGNLFKTNRNEFLIRFSNSDTNSIRIQLGTIDGNVSALRIIESFDSNNDSTLTYVRALLPAQTGELTWKVNADLNITYKDVNSNQMLEMGRQ